MTTTRFLLLAASGVALITLAYCMGSVSTTVTFKEIRGELVAPLDFYKKMEEAWYRPSVKQYGNNPKTGTVILHGKVDGAAVETTLKGMPIRPDGRLICSETLRIRKKGVDWILTIPRSESSIYSSQEMKECVPLMINIVHSEYLRRQDNPVIEEQVAQSPEEKKASWNE